MSRPEQRASAAQFLEWFATHAGKPYLWGGRGDVMWTPQGIQSAPHEGYDCWGAVACALRAAGGPDWRWWNTDRAWLDLDVIASPRPGDLAFWTGKLPREPNDVEHVEVVCGPGPQLGTWRTIGAAGGGSSVLTLRDAQERKAEIRYRLSHLARPHFAGFRALPLTY